MKAACLQIPRLQYGFGAGQLYIDYCERGLQCNRHWHHTTLVLAHAGNLLWSHISDFVPRLSRLDSMEVVTGCQW